MGSVHSSQLSPKQLSDLQRETNLTGDEILDWYRKFQVDFSSSSGMVTKEQFTKLYERLFPLGDPSEFVENVFRSYDLDGNGMIDFREFLCTMSISSSGSIDDRLRWAFSVFDVDCNGYVTLEEVTKIIRGILKMRNDRNEKPDTETVTVEEIARRVISKLDLNEDGRLSSMEFVIGAKMEPELLELLEHMRN